MRKIDNLTFVEAVERLADRVGIQLRYTDDGGSARAWRVRMAGAPAGGGVLRRAAGSPDAVVARQFLSERGFDRQAAERFGVGFAPRDGRACCSICAGGDSTMWSWYLPDWHASLVGTSFRAA